MKELGVWEPLVVKTQTLKTAIEAGTPGWACLECGVWCGGDVFVVVAVLVFATGRPPPD